jgi:hypothetical protein
MKVGDIVRYRQGSIDEMGIIVKQRKDGDFWVQFFDGRQYACRRRTLELV